MAATKNLDPSPIHTAATSFDTLPDSAMVDDKTVAVIFGCTRKTVWTRARSGGIWPQPIKLGLRQTRFRVGDVRRTLAALTNQA